MEFIHDSLPLTYETALLVIELKFPYLATKNTPMCFVAMMLCQTLV